MPPLKNSRHEKVAQLAFKGGLTEQQIADKVGLSKKTGRVQVGRILQNVAVQARIAELHAKTEDKTIASVKERKRILSELARGCITDYQVLTPDGDNAIAYDKDSPNPRAVSELTEQLVASSEEVTIRQKKIKLHNPVAAISELNKMEGAHAPAQVQVEHNIVNLTIPDNGREDK